MVVRVGFIGVGGVAQVHLRALEAIDGARIVAVSDASAEAAQATARRYEGCRAFDDHRTMLDEGELEAVYVCLPPGAHTGQEIDVANSVKLGVIDLMVTGTSIWANLVPSWGVADLGYIFQSYAHQTRALDAGAGKIM